MKQCGFSSLVVNFSQFFWRLLNTKLRENNRKKVGTGIQDLTFFDAKFEMF